MSKPNRRRWRDSLAPEDRAVVREQQEGLTADDPLVRRLSNTPYDLLDRHDDRTVDHRIIDAVSDGLIRWEDWVSPEDMAAAKADAQARYDELIAADRLEYAKK